MQRAPLVAMLAYPGGGSFEYVTVHEIFGVDYSERFGCWYRTRSCAMAPGAVELDHGFTVHADRALDEAEEADLIVVPGWTPEVAIPPEPLLDVLRRAHRRGSRIMSICTGAFILGYAGLLDNRRATTHWATTGLLATLFPAARVDARALFVEDGGILTAAGMSAGMDLALHIVRADFGAEAAATLARRLVLAGYRSGRQTQFVDFPLEAQAADPLLGLLEWMRQHLDQRWSLASLGARVHMSPRTLTRRFHRLTGMTPHHWATRERLLAAQRLLETSDEPIESIAARTGMGSATSLRQLFRRELGMAPQAYRTAFRESRSWPFEQADSSVP